MLEYINRKEKIFTFLKKGLINKGYSFKILSGINTGLNLLKEIKEIYNLELLSQIIEFTSYPNMINVLHGLDNIYNINKKKSEWYLYAINKETMNDIDISIIQESFLNNSTLIYLSEKNMGGKFTKFYMIFSLKKYNSSHEYIGQKWQRR